VFAQMGLNKELCYVWSALTPVAFGDIIIPIGGSNYGYQVTIAGTTGAAAPVWQTVVGNTFTDGGVTYTVVNKLVPSYPAAVERLGMNFVTSRPANKNYAFTLRYNASIPAMVKETDANYWALNQGNLLLYESLNNAMPFIKNQETKKDIPARLKELRMELRGSISRERFSGDRVRTTYHGHLYNC
jgi:hypothetical protein